MRSKRQLHILFADADESIVQISTALLERLGHKVSGYNESLKALRAFSEEPDEFDLAIIEPMLPDITGLDLAIRFRHIRPDLPVLFYAGYVDASLSHRIEADRFGHVAFKPFRLNELAAMIRDRLSPGPEHTRVEKNEG